MSALTNYKIGKRLSLGFGAVTLLLVVITAASIWAQNALNDACDDTYHGAMRTYLSAAIERNVMEIGREISNRFNEN